MKTSKAVDRAIKRTWALLASAAARNALSQAASERYTAAEHSMKQVEDWLTRAGAEATKWVYTEPRR